jgi:subtilisin-like proprotein convertase family protein
MFRFFGMTTLSLVISGCGGESMAGDWTLSAYDHASGTSMMLHSYEIKIEYR